jgi:transposase-like protein
MALYVFLFLLLSALILSLARLCHLYWLHHCLLRSRAGAVHPMVHRLLKPRTPRDCPACRLSSNFSAVVGPSPLPVRPWHEVKSRRGAPKRIKTQGFACPNHQCPYFGIIDALIHALVGDGTHGQVEQIQTFRCQACRTTFSARRHTPLYRLKTPSRQVAVVLTALAEGLDPSAAERVFGYRQATITTWLTRAGEHAQTLHERCFCNLRLPHLQLDELRTRLRSYKQVLWLWLAIDPLTKILPVLQLGPRTQNAAHLLIHSLRQILAPDCLPLFTSDGLNVYFYALTAHFGHWLAVTRRGRKASQWQVAAGLLYGQVKKSYRRRKLVRVTHVMRLGTGAGSQSRLAEDGPLRAAEHRFYRTGESDRPSWGGSAGTPYLGHRSAGPTTPGPPGMVASLLPFCASPRIAPGGPRAAARARWQADGAKLPPAYPSDGSGENQPTMDSAGSVVLSSTPGTILNHLRATEVRRRPAKWPWAAR